ncbi:MAG: hypothetical protein H7832_01065 [Magnetococcus sp. DMHC-6]
MFILGRPFIQILLATFIPFFLLTGTAFANKEIELDFNYERYSGDDYQISLKKRALEEYPALRINLYKLLYVELVAKSKDGQSRARLQVGSWRSPSMRIAGTRHDYATQRPASFEHLYIDNDSHAPDDSAWLLLLKGEVKISKIILHLRLDSEVGDDRHIHHVDPPPPPLYRIRPCRPFERHCGY